MRHSSLSTQIQLPPTCLSPSIQFPFDKTQIKIIVAATKINWNDLITPSPPSFLPPIDFIHHSLTIHPESNLAAECDLNFERVQARLRTLSEINVHSFIGFVRSFSLRRPLPETTTLELELIIKVNSSNHPIE